MSERKVLTKYYPPDFDPSKIVRSRGPKQVGPKQQTVRLMAPFSMKCTACGEYIYKGRKFNARKEITEEKYYEIALIRFYIRCTRCSAEITFKTDPKNMDYTCEKGAKRNFEPWRQAQDDQETDQERLDRLEREEEEKNAMAELETKTLDAKREMAIADALDEIRTRNARIERADNSEVVVSTADLKDAERERQEQEDAEAAKRAFMGRNIELDEAIPEMDEYEFAPATRPHAPEAVEEKVSEESIPAFKKPVKKKKKDFAAALGIKKKPSLV